MQYEFLKNFHKRIEIVSIIQFITNRAQRKQHFKDFGFTTMESTNLIMLVLCFIMEKSLIEEICTKVDISSYLRRLDIEIFKKNISDEDYLLLSDYIIKDCLQNSGIPYHFSTYNFEDNKEEEIHVRLIDDKRVTYECETVYSYYMTPQGYKFMFNTLEIEEAMKVSIEQFKLSISIKKRNFNIARTNIDSLFNMSKTQIQKINYFVKKIKEDIISTGIDEYEDIFNSTFSSIEEQKEGYDNLYDLINKTEASIIDSFDIRLDKENIEEEFQNILYIKNKLKLIINEQSNLLLKQQALQKIYNEAVDNIIYIGFENRISFEDNILKKVEDNIDLSFPLIKILRPLFKPDLNKLYNLKNAIKEQKIIRADDLTEYSNFLMDERRFRNVESDTEIKIRELNEKYLDIFDIITLNSNKIFRL